MAVCITWYGGCAASGSASSGKPPIPAIKLAPLNAEQYSAVVGDENPKAAYLKTQIAARGQTLEEALAADARLSGLSNPFRRDAAVAVANGAVIFAAQCALCHGADASGSGPGMPVGSPKMNFHDGSKRGLLKMTGRAPKSWIESLRNGVTSKTVVGGKPLAMPTFQPTLTNEQMWLAVTYLETIVLNDKHAAE
jgi:mono/diheme cytochrome c family protein